MLAPILGWTVLLFFGRVPTLTALPIAGLSAKDLQDTFDQTRGSGKHEAIDIMSPRGTPVHAVVDGTIAKLFLSKPGGKTIYLFDGDGLFCYYYAHLDRYAPNLRVGQRVSLGQVIAYVGSTGNANPSAPHLHFTIFELGPEKHWWQGVPINPYPALIRLLSNSREMKHQEHSYESGLRHIAEIEHRDARRIVEVSHSFSRPVSGRYCGGKWRSPGGLAQSQNQSPPYVAAGVRPRNTGNTSVDNW